MTVKRTILVVLGMAGVVGVSIVTNDVAGIYGGWATLLLGGYAVGAASVPRGREGLRALAPARRRGQIEARSEKHRVLVVKQLRKNRREVTSIRQHLGRGVAIELSGVIGKLEGILLRWKNLPISVEDQYTIETMVTDYLPVLLNAYRQLPSNRLRKFLLPEQQRARDELLTQIRILDAEIIRIQKDIYSSDLQGLEAHGSFLREKFTPPKSGLELDRD
jgi:hypothetical protein